MNAIQFTTVIGPDGVIRPPPGMELPKGEIEVTLRLRPNPICCEIPQYFSNRRSGLQTNANIHRLRFDVVKTGDFEFFRLGRFQFSQCGG